MKKFLLFLTSVLLLTLLFLGITAFADTPSGTVPEAPAQEDASPSVNEKEAVSQFCTYAIDEEGNRVLIERVILDHDGTYRLENGDFLIIETRSSVDVSAMTSGEVER